MCPLVGFYISSVEPLGSPQCHQGVYFIGEVLH
jgi:hypothetical protein